MYREGCGDGLGGRLVDTVMSHHQSFVVDVTQVVRDGHDAQPPTHLQVDASRLARPPLRALYRAIVLASWRQ